jgi:Ser/Thr protein kinase RdoA (MazF antagonist)
VFQTLTYDQQLMRFQDAAQTVLPVFGLEGAVLEPLSYFNNAVFKASLPTGESTVLRLHRPGHKPITQISSELAWLAELAARTPLAVPQPHTKSVTQVTVHGLDEPVPVVCFRWIEGVSRPERELTLADLEHMGRLLAQLHHHARHFQPPTTFDRPRLDWEGLFGEQSHYNPGVGAAIFTADQQTVFQAVDQRVRATMHKLGDDRMHFGLIHGDYLPKNVLWNGASMAVIDFEDCGWGYWLYDLAPTCLLLRAIHQQPAFESAFIRGYGAEHPLHDLDHTIIEDFMAARHVASCRWQAANLHNPRIRETAATVIARRTEDLKSYLATGTLSIG